jgi:hypothetical protein
VEDPLTAIEVSPEQARAFAVEAEIKKYPQTDIPLDHQFCTGVYARSIFIPKDTILTGLIHREESFFVVRSGILTVSTDNGDTTVFPGFMSITKPGTKRIGYAVTDVIVTTFHANPDEIRENSELVDYLTIPAPETMLEEPR